MEEQPRVCAVGADRILEGHCAGDICIQRNRVADVQRAGHRPAVHAVCAGDVGDVTEIAAVQGQIKAALQRADVVERRRNRAVRRAAVDRQFQVAFHKLIVFIDGRAIDAAEEAAAVDGDIRIADMRIRRDKNQSLAEFAAVYGQSDIEIIVTAGGTAAADALPCTAVDRDIRSLLLFCLGELDIAVCAALDAEIGRGDRCRIGALHTLADHELVEVGTNAAVILSVDKVDIVELGLTAEIEIDIEEQLCIIGLSVVHIVIDRSDRDLAGVVPVDKCARPADCLHRGLAADNQRTAACQRLIGILHGVACRAEAGAVARTAVADVVNLIG